MSFLSIPTDNLYKFMALSGLAILFLSNIPYYYKYKHTLDSIELSGKKDELKSKIDIIKIKLAYIKESTDVIRDDADKLKSIKKNIKLMDENSFESYLQFDNQMNEIVNKLFNLVLMQYDNTSDLTMNVIGV